METTNQAPISKLDALKDHCLSELEAAFYTGDNQSADKACDYLKRLSEVQLELQDLHAKREQSSKLPKFKTGGRFLHDCLDFLDDSADEMIHYVTGIQTDNTRVLSEIVTFDIETRSPSYVRGDIMSAANSLIMLDEHGYKLHAWFHTHPGNGPGAIHPSSIDLTHQKALEKGGYNVVGGIFARDGYVRFFSCDLKYDLEIYGSNVTQIDSTTYKFEV
jgi:hypothetical protein